MLRSPGGKGAVTLGWQLEEKAKDDLSPLNGTLVFTEVHNENNTHSNFNLSVLDSTFEVSS